MSMQGRIRGRGLLVVLVLAVGVGLGVGYGSRSQDPSRAFVAAPTPITGIAQPLPTLEGAQATPREAAPGGALSVASDSRAAGTAEPLLKATCRDVELASPPDPDVIPVVVTYMVSQRRPRDDIRTIFTLERIRKAFRSDGEFNLIWRPKGIRFALAKVRTCEFTLDASVNESIGIPNPDTGDFFETLFIPTLKTYNTRTLRIGDKQVNFHGLDLYLWWKMRSYPGYGVRARFGPSEEEPQRPLEQRQARAGGIWMGQQCATLDPSDDTCAGYFAHEAGHFLGLCHCCHIETGEGAPLNCFNYFKSEYCTGLGGINQGPRDACHVGDLGKRLMSAANSFKGVSGGSLDAVRIEDCEVDAAQVVREKVLRLGANGVKS
jgi:hypothetical protein